ncbi:MAG: pilus (MSHA type) biogenesis protein MshL [Campylobacterales bacterium]|nr:pilus (MSHA type) biogenesis protein MshL [Campylobacterales bacterium]
MIKSLIYGTILTLLTTGNLFADCSSELFSISSTKDTKIIDFIEQLSDSCEFSIVITDSNAEEYLNKQLNKTHLNNLTIDEVLNIVLNENNLSYTLNNNVLKISYLTTKVFAIDYILSQRKSSGSTDITLSSSTGSKTSKGSTGPTGSTGSTSSTGSSSASTSKSTGSSTAESGVKIISSDEVKFWEELDLELQGIINRPHDAYVANPPIINKNAGLITVTCTAKQMTRLEEYLKRLQEKVKLQVLIDVQILAVTMSEGKSTGVDWKQLYALQNFQITSNVLNAQNVGTYSGADITTALYPDPIKGNSGTVSSLVQAKGNVSLKEVIKFLNTQGDVSSISNPKVLTLNNQPALITVGTEYFYKITSTETLAGGTTGASSVNENIQSVFAGVLLDITPEISDDNSITLKINPSLSETSTNMLSTSENRKMPPDLDRRQLSSVVTVKDGNRIILGGLINTKNTQNSSQVPLLGSIPFLGYLFKYDENSKQTQELIIVIEPHIISKEKSNLSLSDLGYAGLKENILDHNKTSVKVDKEVEK